MHRNTYLWVSGENFDTGIRLLDPNFLIRNDIWRFEDVLCWFLHSICWMSSCPPYIYFRSTRPTVLERVSRVFPLAVKISTKFEVDTTVCWLVIAFLLLIHYVTFFDLDLWPFDLGQWSYMAGHMVNPSTKFEAPMAICSWVWVLTLVH